ncbi:MAG: hypothetical protein HN742_38390 [Lentisphaerae bacterium]|jgi:TolA-binding protein|nr:hypothetical protein [Lentisphaerota bacterium]MBT4815804.1 hypothetical protein [Lentisphaerota bacterium]MBT5609292.1 hypothetical protein [Lentisphaerota bacterium]MBT7059414.1 hypothetical protein [Lentisphaerota bacterium]MBT7847798.1 hypothetical protein [Lentisphaerota bacterium]
MKTTGMIATALVVLLGWTCAAQSQDELKQKVHELEKRVAKLEAGLGPVLARIAREQAVEEQRLKARARMRQDSEVYSREALSKIEGLYQIANKKWGSEAGKESLKQLVSHYDKANRTGCALLYLGQMTKGEEQIYCLTEAIDGFSGCYYGDGVQVGAYARLMLANRLRKDGKTDEADALLEEIREQFPNAIDHRGRLLSEILPPKARK